MATPTLKKGSQGQDVVRLQNFLKSQGYNVGKVDGIFGSQTESAVKAFQKSQGLSVDGIVGSKTWSKIGTPSSGKSSSSGAPTIPNIKAYQVDYAKQPKVPTPIEPPKVTEFSPQIDREQLLKEAEEYLMPQYRRTQEKLEDLYVENRQTISDDSLKRGWARGSYTGDRLDREQAEHGKRLTDLDLSFSEQANILASEKYESEWAKQYQLHRDTVSDTWRRYEAQTASQWKKYDALYNAWRDVEGMKMQQHEFTADQAWKKYGAQYDKYIADREFAHKKKMDEANLSLAQQQLNLQKQAAARAKSSGGSSKSSKSASVDPFTLAYNDVFNSKDPVARFRAREAQYRSALSRGDFEILKAQVAAYEAQQKAKTKKPAGVPSSLQRQARPQTWAPGTPW